MKKLVFKFFCRNFVLLSLVLVTILIFGCKGAVTAYVVENTNNNPEVHFCPKEDCGKVLENNINNAGSSVHCAFYDLDLKNVISAISKKSLTTDTRLVIDDANNGLTTKNVPLRFDDDKQLMHNKFCVIDKDIVLTGSFNPTDNDNYLNNNNILIIHSKILAQNYEDEFGEMWNDKFGSGNKVKFPKLELNNIKIENYFCPEDCSLLSSSIDKDKALYKIINLINNAKTSIQLASFTFTNEDIADALIKADARDINVSILTETKQRNVIGSQYQRLKDFGLNIRLDSNKYNMHHKFIVIDGKIVITGSPNFTLSGFNKNDENILIIYDEGLALKYIGEFNRLWDI